MGFYRQWRYLLSTASADGYILMLTPALVIEDAILVAVDNFSFQRSLPVNHIWRSFFALIYVWYFAFNKA